jgi:hypothetical protein
VRMAGRLKRDPRVDSPGWRPLMCDACPAFNGGGSDDVNKCAAGDCYIVAAGVVHRDEDGFLQAEGGGQDACRNACDVMAFALDALDAACQVLTPHDGKPVNIRIGLHTGQWEGASSPSYFTPGWLLLGPSSLTYFPPHPYNA